jgi:ABC-type phosphate transport system substrate-binding protein
VPGQDDIVLVGNKNVPDTLRKEDVKQIFLGKKTRWQDNSKITFVIFNEKDTFTAFLKTYIRKTYPQYRNYWKKQVFTGKGRMPKSFKQPKELFAFLADTEGAVSFVTAEHIDLKLVKVITIE